MPFFKEFLQTYTNRLIAVTVFVHFLVLAVFANQWSGLELFNWNLPQHQWYQFLTHIFLHGSELHLFFNMFALWMFGRPIEHALGKQRFLWFYLLCGVGAGLISMLVDEYVIGQIYTGAMVGASGAIYGLLVAFAVMFPNFKVMLIFLPVPIAAKYFVPILLLIDLSAGVTGISIFGQNIAHFAHIGGAVIGFVVLQYYRSTAR